MNNHNPAQIQSNFISEPDLSPPIPLEARKLSDKLKKGKVLRYQIDMISVAVVIFAAVIQFMAYWYHWPWYSLIVVLILMRASHLAEHNHTHLPIFYNNSLNEMLGWVMFLNCGIPLQSYREQHAKVHHQYIGTLKDWTSPWVYQGTVFPTKPINKIYYICTFMIFSMFQCAIIYLKKPLSKATLSFVVSMVVVCGIMAMLAWHDLSSFMIFYAIPWLVTYLRLAAASWEQHVGCEYTSVYTIAYNDFNLDSGVLGFNIGYHTAHHWYPNLHWSLLQEFHKTYLAPHIPQKYYTPIWFSSLWKKTKNCRKQILIK